MNIYNDWVDTIPCPPPLSARQHQALTRSDYEQMEADAAFMRFHRSACAYLIAALVIVGVIATAVTLA